MTGKKRTPVALPSDLPTWFAARLGQAVQVTSNGKTTPVIPVQVYDDAVSVADYDPTSGALTGGGARRMLLLSVISAVAQPRPAPTTGEVVR
jgi:hypothetical protein